MIKTKMMLEEGWAKTELDRLEELYRNFLQLKFKYGKTHIIPPNAEIDDFWHNHILDTEKYIEDCNNIFGIYLHHYPYASLPGSHISKEELYQYFSQNTQQLHFKEFGYYIYKVKPTIKEILTHISQLLLEQLRMIVKSFKSSMQK